MLVLGLLLRLGSGTRPVLTQSQNSVKRPNVWPKPHKTGSLRFFAFRISQFVVRSFADRSARPCPVDGVCPESNTGLMNAQERLSQEIKAAMLAKDADRLSTLRLLKSAVGYAQIERKTDNLSEADFISVVQKEVKKRRDSIEQFEKGGRSELADRERKEVVILETFLPAPLSQGDLEALVKSVISEMGATGKKDMGPVIKAVQAKAGGRAEGKTISSVVAKLLP